MERRVAALTEQMEAKERLHVERIAEGTSKVTEAQYVQLQ